MGLADVIGPEERIQLKFSEYCNLIKAEAERRLLINALKTRVPYDQVWKMLSGENDEYEDYKSTGLTPDQIREIDKEYSEICKKAALLKAENDALKREVELLKSRTEAPAEKLPSSDSAIDQPDILPLPPTLQMDYLNGALGIKPDQLYYAAAQSQDSEADATQSDKLLQEGKKKQPARRKVDVGKIMALKKAGWKTKDIADEMGMEPKAVSNVIWYESKKVKENGETDEDV